MTENSRQGDAEGSDRDNNRDAKKSIQKLKRKDVEMAVKDEVGSDLRRLLEPDALPPAGSKEASTISSLHSSDENVNHLLQSSSFSASNSDSNFHSAEAKKGRRSDWRSAHARKYNLQKGDDSAHEPSPLRPRRMAEQTIHIWIMLRFTLRTVWYA